MSVIQEKGSNDKESEVYFNFINSIRSDVTKEIYGYNIKVFMKSCNVESFYDLFTMPNPQAQILHTLPSAHRNALPLSMRTLNIGQEIESNLPPTTHPQTKIITPQKKKQYYDSQGNEIPQDDIDAINDIQGGRRIVYYKEEKAGEEYHTVKK